MKKHCDYYYTTQRHIKGEIARGIKTYHYTWHIRNQAGEELQSSLGNDPEDQYYDDRGDAEQEARDAIKEHYR